VAPAVRQAVETITTQTAQPETTTLARQDIAAIYKKQKKHIGQHIEVPAQAPYVVAQTTVLGNYLSDQDWHELARDKVTETEFLNRLTAKFDEEIHIRIQRAAEKAGYVNVRGHVRAGVQQVASFSDDLGHGVRVAISHKDESQIGVDLIGYQGGECESKRRELLDALAAEGITIEDVKTIRHDDPEGFKGKLAAHKHRAQRRRDRRQQQRRV
jgi:hypothetical protein